MKKTLYEYCVETGRSVLVSQWCEEDNAPLTPRGIGYGGKQKVFWLCEKGHRWQATISSRTLGGSRCPYCSGLKALVGSNDLATLYPEVAAQWHPTKNGTLTPTAITSGSNRKVWWRCEMGHEWKSRVASRILDGCGCPVCADKTLMGGFNDLTSRHPEIAAQWHPTKNGTLTPKNVMFGSHRKAWWICGKGHEWQAVIYSRTSRRLGCPFCDGKQVVPGGNDLASHFPEIAAQWHPTKNGHLKPTDITPYSNRKVWWRCPLGHDYQSVVGSKTRYGKSCPFCAGRKVLVGFNDLATRQPKIAEQWHPTLNESLTPEMVTCGSHKMVWWQCADGHVWKAVIYSRAGKEKYGCPVCAGNVKKDRKRLYESMSEQQFRAPDK